ncbi:protease inhibitor [Mesorhizobium sp. CAU 1741]|uniref:protease inhibitor n=1 Tax=Mesorhizobium sp. CAU 1741 TaxID=3140366 RepID=UPI00325BB357
MQFLSVAKIAAGLAITGTILAACVVVEESPGMRPPPPPGRGGGICTREYAPVCGEYRGRFQTFGNACVARSEGYSIVSRGECRGERPRPPRGNERPRPRPEFGNDRPRPPIRGERPRPPVERERPRPQVACTQDYRPVCAQRDSDVRTFGNECSAAAEGYRMIRPGECGANTRP